MTKGNSYAVIGKRRNLQTRLYLIAAGILIVGLGIAIAIYITAVNTPDNELVYEFEHSKRYIHDMELYGGKITVLAHELRSWFTGLWHGTSLAFTVACISMATSLGIFFVAYHLPPDTESDTRAENLRDKTE